MTARRAELEAAIDRDPYDTRLYEVYGDYLQQLGDPRGELILLQIAAPGNPDAALAASTHFHRHAEAFVGTLPKRMRWRSATRDGRVRWQNGFIHSAVVPADAKQVRSLISHPSGRFLIELGIDYCDDGFARATDVLASRVDTLRRLSLGTGPHSQHFGIGALDELWPRIARLRDLSIRAGAVFESIDLPELETLEIEARGLQSETVRAIAHASWSNLVTLRLRLAVAAPPAREFGDLLARASMPCLTTLAVCHPDLDDVIESLAATSLVRGLRVLDLSKTSEFVQPGARRLTDRGAAQLARHADAFGHLDTLDVRGNRLSPVGVRLLAGIAKTLRADGQGEPDPDADDRDPDLYDY